MLKEAVQSSYRRGGEETSLTTDVNKQTVKNKIHELEFPRNEEKPDKKKVVEYLYIEADQDHASLQFREKKGDLEENTEFWDEVYEYISSHYELDKVKKIYINADGGTWIKSGMKRIAGITYVLDEFHLEKYLTKLTSHMKDSKEDAKAELRNAIREKIEEIVQQLEGCPERKLGLLCIP